MPHPSAAEIVGLYERRAAQWDRDRPRALIEKAWLDRFAALLPTGGTVLDIGCGGGEPVAAYLIGQRFRLIGIDSAPSLIALCQTRFPLHDWMAGDMRTLDLGRRFDGLIAWHSFFHLSREDQRAMFPRFRDHAVPGAALLFTSGPHDGEAIGSYRGEPLHHASLAPDAYRALLAENGFEVAAQAFEDPDCGGATVWLARLK